MRFQLLRRRWHEPKGRERRLRSLGLRERMLKVAQRYRGSWHLAATGSLHAALSNARLKRHGFLMPSDLAECAFNSCASS